MSQTLKYFEEITKVPRPSKKEEKIRDFMIHWAKEKAYAYKRDEIGNLVIYVPAKKSETKEPLILQSHLDMVCVKTEDSDHDFETDTIKTYEEDGFIKAQNTSLGADNGIGMAFSMASTEFDSHPPLELFFTVDEEEWMSGALNFDASLLSGKNIINIDSWKEDTICIWSAFSARVGLSKKVETQEKIMKKYKLEIFWMKWGHSWLEINENRWNAVIFFLDFLKNYTGDFEIEELNWWKKENVIPSSLEAIIWVWDIRNFETKLRSYKESYKKEIDCPNLDFTVKHLWKTSTVISWKEEIIKKVFTQKVWPLIMSKKDNNFVESSNNLGFISLSDKWLKISYLARAWKKEYLDKTLEDLKENFNDKYWYTIDSISSYDWWDEDTKSPLVKKVKKAFEKVRGDVKLARVHAGLECGSLVGWLGWWASALSIGPNMYDIHSTEERLEIASVEKIEKILKELLKNY